MVKKILILCTLSLFSACGGDSSTSTTSAPTPTPTPPSTVTIAVDSASVITVAWSEVADVSEYEIYRSTNTIIPSVRLATATSTSYVDTALSGIARYYYWVKDCFTADNCSDYSNRVSASTVPAPSTVTATASEITTIVNGINTITVVWSEIANASYYEIYRSISTVAVSSTIIYISAASNRSSYADTGVSISTNYHYWVKACNGKLCSMYSNIASASIALIDTGKLNDTGIVFAGNYPTGNSDDCTSKITNPQDCHQGRDASTTLMKMGAGIAGFDFTKLGSNGNVLTIQNATWTVGGIGTESTGTKWSCVRDNVTGSVWEVKTDAGSKDANTTDTTYTNIHHKNNEYRWGGVTADGATAAGTETGIHYDDWTSLVNGTNNENLCGFNNWRVPTMEQLRGILDLGGTSPDIDKNYFPNTIPNYFWSSNASAAASAAQNSDAWEQGFSRGGYSFDVGRKTSNHVRLVRLGK